MSRYLNIPEEVIPFYVQVRSEVPLILRNAYLLSEYYGVGAEAVRQASRLAGVLNAIEANMQHFDECCDGTLYDETRTILRLCGAISGGYAGPVTPDTSYETYVRRLDNSVQRIREAVSEVRELANLYTCEYCGQVERECECVRCDYCGERDQDCECATCEYCDRNEHACVCDRCVYCGANIHACYCERCDTCDERLEDCVCPPRRDTTLDYPI